MQFHLSMEEGLFGAKITCSIKEKYPFPSHPDVVMSVYLLIRSNTLMQTTMARIYFTHSTHDFHQVVTCSCHQSKRVVHISSKKTSFEEIQWTIIIMSRLRLLAQTKRITYSIASAWHSVYLDCSSNNSITGIVCAVANLYIHTNIAVVGTCVV